MFKRKLTISDFLLIVVNLVPLYGVWFENWDARQVFLVYCMETVIVGLINVVKMACVTIFVKKQDVWENGGSSSMQSGWLFIFFFIAHYGFFVFVQTQIFFAITGMLPDGSMLMRYSKIPALLGPNGRLLLLIFIVYYTAQNVFSFFSSGEYKTISMGRLLFQPYLRIFVQQFVVILGSIFLSFGAGKIFILVFVVIKIFFELFVNLDRLLEIAEKKQRLKDQLKK
ncbi:DUF6498-containing protein [Ferruginibacter sp. SUN106]|uniref:DUF6498-containing protein n=1 Tax=Ferruginibacter sp. SUN106 TaxID=2978348 RepID=UPI003D359C8E